MEPAKECHRDRLGTPYEIIHYDRKTMTIVIKPDGKVIVKAPSYASDGYVGRFVDSCAERIAEKRAVVLQQCANVAPTLTVEQMRELMEAARLDLPPRVARYAAQMGVTYGRITIGPQKAHWGYCSVKGDLRFNSLIMLCPAEIRDYLVVHELCHRRVLNHRPPFWAEVQKVLPDYAERKQWLDEHGLAVIRLMP